MRRSAGPPCHGAGRRMSRTQAKASVRGKSIVQEMEKRGVLVASASQKTLAEEFPEAYKDVSEGVGVVDDAARARGGGGGSHAVPLARRGYVVTGVDLSSKMRDTARARARREGVTVEWVREDMGLFRRPGAFDLCLSLFTSFGFFSDEENQRVLDNVAVSLREGGTLLLALRNSGKGLSRLEHWDQTIEGASGERRL